MTSYPKPDVRLIHFNDIYHISPVYPDSDVPGGAARFVSLVKAYKNQSKYIDIPELVTVFSGDAFNPSLESSVMKGEHMVDLMNKDHIGIDIAVYGNHDFDFGVDQLIHLKNKCDFPWMIANVYHNNKPIAEAVPYVIKEVSGIKIGFIGLVEPEWLETINSLPPDLEYRPFTEVGLELATKLRNEDNCDMIVAVTHMREPNDLRLAKELPPGTIDLVLGGHDHFYSHKIANGVDVLCSGTDFRDLSYIEGFLDQKTKRWKFDIIRRVITSDIAEYKPTKAHVEALSGYMNQKLDIVIGWTHVPLDARFTVVRSQESNLGNFVADILRVWYDADIALIAGGTLRSDTIMPSGPIRLKDIVLTFPFEDPCVVIKVTGQELLDALENSVSRLPALEGRFLQVSGMRYTFSLETTPRIRSVEINGRPLDVDKMYSCATRGYMMHGKDGFSSLKVSKDRQIIDEEQGLLLVQMLRMWFLSLKLFGRWRQKASQGDIKELEEGHLDGDNKSRLRVHNLIVNQFSQDDLFKNSDYSKEKELKIERKILSIWKNDKSQSLDLLDLKQRGIAPEVDGRIKQVDAHGRELM
ncbi:Metallo-dependent phosphatase-like protein [Dipodascopsis uninucleata]